MEVVFICEWKNFFELQILSEPFSPLSVCLSHTTSPELHPHLLQERKDGH